MSKPFDTTQTIHFREADPAQIMYFGNLFSFAHDAFEEFIVAAGYTYKEWFGTTEHLIPIRHAEADFLSPFFAGETYDVSVTVAQIRETSFQMKYVFSKNGKTHAEVRMVHAVLSLQTKQKMKIPPLMQQRLSPYLETP